MSTMAAIAPRTLPPSSSIGVDVIKTSRRSPSARSSWPFEGHRRAARADGELQRHLFGPELAIVLEQAHRPAEPARAAALILRAVAQQLCAGAIDPYLVDRAIVAHDQDADRHQVEQGLEARDAAAQVAGQLVDARLG